MKAPSEAELNKMVEDARQYVEKMTDEEYAQMCREQQAAIVRALTTPCVHGVLDFEECEECRKEARDEQPE